MKGFAILMQTLMNWLKMTKFKNFMTYKKVKNCAKKNGTILKKEKRSMKKKEKLKKKCIRKYLMLKKIIKKMSFMPQIRRLKSL